MEVLGNDTSIDQVDLTLRSQVRVQTHRSQSGGNRWKTHTHTNDLASALIESLAAKNAERQYRQLLKKDHRTHPHAHSLFTLADASLSTVPINLE